MIRRKAIKLEAGESAARSYSKNEDQETKNTCLVRGFSLLVPDLCLTLLGPKMKQKLREAVSRIIADSSVPKQ